MNEKIEELAEQAVEEMDPEAFSEDMNIPPEWYQKFAELIAKECANVADEWMKLNDGCTFNVGDKIKEHFGVK